LEYLRLYGSTLLNTDILPTILIIIIVIIKRIFKQSKYNIIEDSCQTNFTLKLPSEFLTRSGDKFLLKLTATNNVYWSERVTSFLMAHQQVKGHFMVAMNIFFANRSCVGNK